MTDSRRERILVVDDDPGMCRVASRVLGSLYDVETAGSAAEAKTKLVGQHFHVALVDLYLDDGDGYSLCHRIRSRWPATDVILMTGSVNHSDEKLYRSLEEGAFYFLFKPFERRVLRALVERCLRLQAERRAKERFALTLAEDLRSARRFQASLLPGRPLDRDGWLLHGTCRQCDALGGDFYLYLAEPSNAIVFAICDVVGHGVKAAMYAGMMRSTLDAARRRDPDPAAVVQEIATGLGFFEPQTIATMVYGMLQPDGKLHYFNAGHPPLLWQRSDGTLRRLPATGLILSSALAGHQRSVESIDLQPGDRLLTYTDGIIEAQDPSGGELKPANLEAALAEVRAAPPHQVLDHLLACVDTHRAGRPLEDDVTLLVIDRTEA